MDQISHLNKRNVMSPRTPRVSQVPQYYQYENEAQPSDQQCLQQQSPPPHYEQLVPRPIPMQAPVPIPSQVIHYQYYDPPMTLNAWTQVNSNELPSVNAEMEELKAKTKELEDRLREQDELIEGYKKSIATKQESTTYRILAQADESHSEDKIEIEISNPSESRDNMISSSTLYTAANANEETSSDHGYEYSRDQSFDTSQMSNSKMTTLGPRYTQIPTEDFEKISWSSPSVATRKLLTTVFDREVLATHSMTGKASPAFKDHNKPVKGQLNPDAIQDIVYIVSKKCGVSAKEVRSAITTKCADENKMLKLKELKANIQNKQMLLNDRNRRNSSNKEN